MTPASIQHVGRAVDAFQGQARFNERNEEAAVANTELERRPSGPTNHVCVDRVVGERGTRWHPSVVGDSDHAVIRCAHRQPVDKSGSVTHTGILLGIPETVDAAPLVALPAFASRRYQTRGIVVIGALIGRPCVA
jgi:hypothetical protein